MADEPRERPAPGEPANGPGASRPEPAPPAERSRWAGWGAGPAGAGAVGGPTRLFLAVALIAALAVAAVLFRDGKRVECVVALGAAVYFGLRLFGGLGRRST